ncbi:MAG TPA: extracellular solute-binding protein [Clostridiales bacterium]|nr:extracellular solute-binding protein [Clostridiales bacterium]
MKKFITSILCVLLVCCSLIGCFGDGKNKSDYWYPDRGYADDKSDSWTQLTDQDEEITIDWFVNYSTFSWAGNGNSLVSDVIREKTKININFITPADDTGQQLNTLIASGKLPDVVTVNHGTALRVQLQQEKYVYPLQELAKRYAPSLLNRIDDEIVAFFDGGNGTIYGLPNHYYTYSDLNDYKEITGMTLNSNGAIVARKDYLDAYIAYKKAQNPNWSDVQATTPQGFIEMCLWVKQHYNLLATNPTVCIGQFDSATTNGSKGISWLMEYFAVDPEDEDGNKTYEPAQAKYKDALLFLNELYRNKLISSGNLSANYSQISTYIQQGLPFVCMLSPQDFASFFRNAYLNSGIEYVPIVLRNYQGDVPVLRDLSGNGYRFSMITTSCKYPDRVIKLFDFLWSEEGQRLIQYGVEGETFEYTKRPGETGAIIDPVTKQTKTVTYKYGQIKYTDEVFQEIQNGQAGKYGFMGGMLLLINPMHARLTHYKGETLDNFLKYVDYNLKAALQPYTYSRKGLEFGLDTSDSRYVAMAYLQTELNNLWYENIPRIISQSSKSAAENLYNSTLAQAELKGYKTLLSFQNSCFKAHKAKLGIQYAWPPNDPNSGYSNWVVNSIFGDTSRVLEIPSDITLQ